ncbi:hypothetical protein AcW1_001319 [Taiwanofungus camphoratus]|nr:hypothetical protein AcW1_001319 [Antrodia cinnamomea]
MQLARIRQRQDDEPLCALRHLLHNVLIEGPRFCRASDEHCWLHFLHGFQQPLSFAGTPSHSESGLTKSCRASRTLSGTKDSLTSPKRSTSWRTMPRPAVPAPNTMMRWSSEGGFDDPDRLHDSSKRHRVCALSDLQ